MFLDVCLCLYVCAPMCGNYPNSTGQNTIIEPPANIRPPPPPPPPRFPKFSFPGLLTEKIKTSHVTPKSDKDGRHDEEREKRLMCSFATSECNVEATVLFCNHNREKGNVPNHITKCCFSKTLRTRGGSEIMAPKNSGIFCKEDSFLYLSPRL